VKELHPETQEPEVIEVERPKVMLPKIAEPPHHSDDDDESQVAAAFTLNIGAKVTVQEKQMEEESLEN